MWQPVLMINGFVLTVLGAFMLVPAGLDFYDNPESFSPFLNTALVTLFIGFGLFLAHRGKIQNLTLRQGYLITFFAWLSVSLFASLPFMTTGVLPNFFSAFFESVSGVTTTGASVIEDVEVLPRSVLLWRSILNGIGGIGIVIFAVAMLPFLGIGGMQMFQRENASAADKLMPRFMDMTKAVMTVYVFLVLLCAVLLYACGMGKFDALNHALSAVATAGFSTKNASVGYFNSFKIEFVLTIFMILGALPLTVYISLWKRRAPDSVKSAQIKYFIKAVALLVFFVALFLRFKNGTDFIHALRGALFNVVSVMTTTGLFSENVLDWGTSVTVFFVLLSLHGGCVGSTTGAVKVMRWQVLYAYLKKIMINAVDQNRVVPVKLGSASIDDKTINSVFVFLLLFLVVISGVSLGLNLMGYDFATSVAAAVSTVTNTGPGMTQSIGPVGNFAFFTGGAKMLLCAAMLLGRLEILAILIVFTKSFWKK